MKYCHDAVYSRSKFFPTAAKLWFASWIVFLLVAGSSVLRAPNAGEPTIPIPSGTRLNLTLKGYNYTSRYIDEFSVNGQPGGNLYVSGPTSGGGSSVCCVSYVQGAIAHEVTVRWHSGGCMFRAAGVLSDGSTHLAHSFFRELNVKVDPHIPGRPKNFEVHFYPDGHVEGAITDRTSPPRLVYSKDRADRSDFPRCPGDKEPK